MKLYRMQGLNEGYVNLDKVQYIDKNETRVSSACTQYKIRFIYDVSMPHQATESDVFNTKEERDSAYQKLMDCHLKDLRVN